MSKKEVVRLIKETAPKVTRACAGIDGNCRYRLSMDASDTERCPIGHAIKDEYYDSSFEGWAVASNVSIKRALRKSGYDIKRSDLDILLDYQNCHDLARSSASFIDTFRKSVLNLIDEYKLPITEAELFGEPQNAQ